MDIGPLGGAFLILWVLLMAIWIYPDIRDIILRWKRRNKG